MSSPPLAMAGGPFHPAGLQTAPGKAAERVRALVAAPDADGVRGSAPDPELDPDAALAESPLILASGQASCFSHAFPTEEQNSACASIVPPEQAGC